MEMEFANAYIEWQKREKGISMNISSTFRHSKLYDSQSRFVQAAFFVVLNDYIQHTVAKADKSGAKHTYLLEE